VRVKMINFMIYELEEMFPGPGLNLLLGPNGSGKSTVMSAIAVCLAGEIKSVGRLNHLGEYVRRGAAQGAVEVELFGGGPAGRNLVVYRSFSAADHSDKSKFMLNGAAAAKKDVQAKMRELHIQVNNLCVFLAQFRVGEFAEMSAEQMLQETEKAANADLFHMHMSIKDSSTELCQKAEAIAQTQRVFEQLRDKVAAMEVERRAEEERQVAVQKITLLRKRRQWALYEQMAEKVDKAKEHVAECKKAVDDERQKEAPLRNALKLQKRADTEARARRDDLAQKHESAKRHRAALEKSVAECTELIDQFDGRLQELEAEQAHRARDLEKERTTLAAQKAALSRARPDEEIVEVLKVANETRQRHREAQMRHDRAVADIHSQMAEAHARKRAAESRLQHIESREVDTPLRRLQKADRSRGQRGTVESDELIVNRLRAAGSLRGKVLGPLLGHVHVTDREVARYVEDTIPVKWAVAWVVENADDHKLLHDSKVRGAIITADVNAPPRPRQFNLAPLARFDVHWLDEGINADPLISAALRDVLNFGLHVYSRRALSPDECHSLLSARKGDGKLQSLYSGTQHFSTMASNWTSDVAVSVNVARPPRILGGSGADEGREREIATAKKEITDAQEQLNELTEQKRVVSNAWEEKLHERQEELRQCEATRIKAAEDQQQRKRIVASIARCEENIRRLEAPGDFERKRLDLLRQQQQLELKREKYMEQLAASVESFEDTSAFVAVQLHAVTAAAVLAHMQASVDSLGNRHEALQAALQEAQRRWLGVQKEAESQKNLATAGCAREAFAELEWMCEMEKAYGQLTVELIDAKANELQNALNRGVGDASIVQRYEVEKANLDEAELRLQQAKGQEESLLKSVEDRKRDWMSKVGLMIKTIDQHFEKYFNRIGCKGNVELQELPNGGYGILIKVSFRLGVAPQPLSASAQSGGEKSVATMLYLLCLQEVTHCPFRMVDEINQGMDAMNERRIFNQIVRSCEDARLDDHGVRVEPPQYFVVTPKLLPGLHYSKRVSVFNVFNGPKMLPQDDWDLERFVRIASSGKLDEEIKRKKARMHAQRQEQQQAEPQGSQMMEQI